MPEQEFEICKGCGAEAQEQPITMVAKADMEADTGPFVTYPICDACWRDPAHRVTPLKGHFFDRLDKERALDGARRQVMLQDHSRVPEKLDPVHHDLFKRTAPRR